MYIGQCREITSFIKPVNTEYIVYFREKQKNISICVRNFYQFIKSFIIPRDSPAIWNEIAYFWGTIRIRITYKISFDRDIESIIFAVITKTNSLRNQATLTSIYFKFLYTWWVQHNSTCVSNYFCKSIWFNKFTLKLLFNFLLFRNFMILGI